MIVSRISNTLTSRLSRQEMQYFTFRPLKVSKTVYIIPSEWIYV